REASSEDHYLGDLNAPIKFIEYSDLECPYCQQFHLTLYEEIKPEYIDTGKIVWIFRNLPLIQIHSKAQREAEAAECVASLAGNDAFWQYIDIIFRNSPLNNGLNLSKLPEFAVQIGVNEKAFNECLQSGDYQADVKLDSDEAQALGATGTPFSVIMKNGEIIGTLPGVVEASQLKNMFDEMLAN
ncbi:MAG: hypothetical protein COV57_00005, partial [Candidatus Liptonbacteria bacterium CG11_big_fil_rev_8_21_14_0_20_35_14]